MLRSSLASGTMREPRLPPFITHSFIHSLLSSFFFFHSFSLLTLTYHLTITMCDIKNNILYYCLLYDIIFLNSIICYYYYYYYLIIIIIIFSPPPGGIYISYYLLFYRSPIPPCTARTQHCTIITASTQHCTIYYISISYNSIHTAGTQHCTIYYISISYNSRHTALYYSNIASHSGIKKLKLVEMVCT